MEIIKNKNILVTGADGFLGKYVSNELIKRGANLIKLTKDDDLTTEFCVDKYSSKQIDYIIHLAGYNGGISFNQSYPFDIFTRNTIMSINALKISLSCKSTKFLGVLTSCGYPSKNGDNIFEDTYLDDKPHESISSHGFAKRNLLISCQMANKQYGLNAVCVVPNTIYGPGDTVDPLRTKVMMAMIKRFVDAKISNQNEVICWGTGNPIREFIYVKDTAELIIQSLISYDDVSKPLNLSTGQFLSIKELAEKVATIVDFKGNILWDNSKPDGQNQKVLNTETMGRLFKNFSPTKLEFGIKETVDWYLNLQRNPL